MKPEPTGEYIGLVVRFEPGADGVWTVAADGTHTLPPTPLIPGALVLRLWRSDDGTLLRGTVQLHGTDIKVPIQSNMQLERLVQAWLLGGSSGL